MALLLYFRLHTAHSAKVTRRFVLLYFFFWLGFAVPYLCIYVDAVRGYKWFYVNDGDSKQG